MHTNNILVPEQLGFRKGLFTENAAFNLTDNILKAINPKMHVGGIFCDLAKAFDCVNHEILLAKLHFYGSQGTAANWFRSCLTNRKEKVEIKPSLASFWFILWNLFVYHFVSHSIQMVYPTLSVFITLFCADYIFTAYFSKIHFDLYRMVIGDKNPHITGL
jgi:hypothetical protein